MATRQRTFFFFGVLSCLMSYCCMLSTVWHFDHISGEEGLVPLLVVGL